MDKEIALRFTSIEQRLDTFVTKIEFESFKDQMLTHNDEVLKILKRLDQERYFTFEKVQNLEKDVDCNKEEIIKIKHHLKVK